MKKSLIIMMALALVLSTSVAFAGLTVGSAGNTTESGTLVNNAQAQRTFNFTITCEGESQPASVPVTPGIPLGVDYSGEYADMDQSWSVIVVDDAGAQIATATFTYTNQQFQPQTIGEGLTFETSGPTFTLTVTK